MSPTRETTIHWVSCPRCAAVQGVEVSASIKVLFGFVCGHCGSPGLIEPRPR